MMNTLKNFHNNLSLEVKTIAFILIIVVAFGHNYFVDSWDLILLAMISIFILAALEILLIISNRHPNLWFALKFAILLLICGALLSIMAELVLHIIAVD